MYFTIDWLTPIYNLSKFIVPDIPLATLVRTLDKTLRPGGTRSGALAALPPTDIPRRTGVSPVPMS
jgi:hypothetical protein